MNTMVFLLLLGSPPGSADGKRPADVIKPGPNPPANELMTDSCGALSLTICLMTLGQSKKVREIDLLCGNRGNETTLLDCHDAAKKCGCHCRSYDWDELPGSLPLAECPAILPIRPRNGSRHFVAAVGASREKLLMIDYPHAPGWITPELLRSKWQWDGTMLHIARDPAALDRLEQIARRRRIHPVPLGLGLAAIAVGLWLWATVVGTTGRLPASS